MIILTFHPLYSIFQEYWEISIVKFKKELTPPNTGQSLTIFPLYKYAWIASILFSSCYAYTSNRRRLLHLRGRKFDWLGVILISLVVQFITLQFLIFIEVKLLPTISDELLVKINFFVIAFIGGLVATHYYKKFSPNMGGICAALFIVLSELYSRHFTFSFTLLFVLLVAYLAGYVGSTLYTNKLIYKRVR